MDDIKIRYTSHHDQIIPWLDSVIRDKMEKRGYKFIGSGFAFINSERDLQFRMVKKSVDKEEQK